MSGYGAVSKAFWIISWRVQDFSPTKSFPYSLRILFRIRQRGIALELGATRFLKLELLFFEKFSRKIEINVIKSLPVSDNYLEKSCTSKSSKGLKALSSRENVRRIVGLYNTGEGKSFLHLYQISSSMAQYIKKSHWPLWWSKIESSSAIINAGCLREVFLCTFTL